MGGGDGWGLHRWQYSYHWPSVLAIRLAHQHRLRAAAPPSLALRGEGGSVALSTWALVEGVRWPRHGHLVV